MLTFLNMLHQPARAEDSWQQFLRSRDALSQKMHLEVCNGCDGCGGRCTGGFGVTYQEWEAVRDYLKTLPAEEVERVTVHQNKTVPWPGAEDSGATVTLCKYRDIENNNCFVYPARPTICRLFGQTHWLPCPIDAVPSYPEDAPQVWNIYRGFYRRTFAEWEAWEAVELTQNDEEDLASCLEI